MLRYPYNMAEQREKVMTLAKDIDRNRPYNIDICLPIDVIDIARRY